MIEEIICTWYTYLIPGYNIKIFNSCLSVRADTDMYRLSAPIWTFYRYIGFADKAIAYRYRLSVSADMVPHIGS